MNKNRQETALEWLLNKIEAKNGTEFSSYYSEFIEQAKQMEREQLEKAFNPPLLSDYLTFDEYYTKTYGTRLQNETN